MKAGGALTTLGKKIFAFKGGNKKEFYAYDITNGRWGERRSILDGAGKGVKDGGALTSDGLKRIYAIKGNNTLEFFFYEVERDSWHQLQSVPLGKSGKRIKGGGGVTFLRKGDSSFIFLIKGGGTNEFFKYWIEGDTWRSCAEIPKGKSNKGLKKGSCLVNHQGFIFLLKGGTNEFYAYSIENDSWLPKREIPLYAGTSQKKRKVGSGAALTSDGEERIYAFKGNCNEFYRYFPAGDSWVEKETLPRYPSERKVKDGGALTFADGNVYALKGNRTIEFWCYTPQTTHSHYLFPGPMGDAFSNQETFSLFIRPNPTRGKVYIHYKLPAKEKPTLKIYNTLGKILLSIKEKDSKESGFFPIEKLPAGVYFFHFATKGNRKEGKLVIFGRQD